MTATFVLLMVVVVSGVLLGCLFGFWRRPAAGREATNPGGDAGWIPAIMSDGGGSDCSAGDGGCGDGGGGGGGD